MRSSLVLVALLAGCGQEISDVGAETPDGKDRTMGSLDPDAGVPAPDAATSPDAAPQPASLKRCTGRPFVGSPPGEFNHLGSEITALASAEHAGYDVLVTGPATVVAHAKLQYGPIFKDLEDEDVRVYLDDCTGWQLRGVETTDRDGRISHEIAGLGHGVYELRFEVVGDATTTSAELWILPEGTRLAVFDIDGTLTTSDFELVKEFFDEIVSGDFLPEAYPGAVELTHAVRDVGYVGVYMTGRPYWLSRPTRSWLAELGFAPGPLFLAPSNGDALPTNGGVGDYKLGTLEGFLDEGLVLDWAHGNAKTDVYAYLGAEIPAPAVWIIGKHAGLSGTVGVEDSWHERVLEIEALPPVAQPFSW